MFSEFNETYTGTYKYYFDVIMKPFSRFMLRAIDHIKPLDIEFICPGHGPIHHKNLKKAIELSEKYASDYMKIITPTGQNNLLIAYVSAYGYTKEAAEIIAGGVLENGEITIKMVDIENISDDELETDIIKCEGMLVGSPTINQNTLLPVYKLLALINPLRIRENSVVHLDLMAGAERRQE